MRKYKTVITATVVSALMLSSLSACSSDDNNENETTQTTTQATTIATTVATTKETTEDPSSVCCVEYYYGVDVSFSTEIASDEITADYVDSDSENSKIILFTPDDAISEIVYTGISTEPFEDWYTITSCPDELAVFESADKDNPIAIQMDITDGNPTRAFQYADSEGSYHLSLIQYDSATDSFHIEDTRAAG